MPPAPATTMTLPSSLFTSALPIVRREDAATIPRSRESASALGRHRWHDPERRRRQLLDQARLHLLIAGHRIVGIGEEQHAARHLEAGDLGLHEGNDLGLDEGD